MQAFAGVFAALDSSTATNHKVAALLEYFRAVPARDAVSALRIFLGERPKRVLSSRELQALIARASGLPSWLVEDCYAQVGDLAETCTLLCGRVDDCALAAPASALAHDTLADWVERHIPRLAKLSAEARDQEIIAIWQSLQSAQAFIFNKLLGGSLRVGVARGLIVRALAQLADLPLDLITHRLMGTLPLSGDDFTALLSPDNASFDSARPYPFFLASALADAKPVTALDLQHELGDASAWQAEWKWDGMRAQIIRRAGQCILVSRGEERLDGRFPELEAAARALADGCVLDGEILVWHPGRNKPENFGALQKRIGKLKPSPALRQQQPVRFLAYDLLELDGADMRASALRERRAMLKGLLQTHALNDTIAFSDALEFNDYESLCSIREQARSAGVEGLMLKRKSSSYQSGRRRGDWWKWKLDPLCIDAVMIYAQAGHGRRANLHTDYTFALWHEGHLVTIAKAYSGLDDAEILELDRWIRKNTRDRFGPVRTVHAEQVFELGFEAVHLSSRHKSGVALRFPRILRWRRDKPASEADTLSTLQALAGNL
jgi:DNA ligase 1